MARRDDICEQKLGTHLLGAIVALAVMQLACKDEPPPDPLGGCAKARAAFEKIEAGLQLVVNHTPDVAAEAYCKKLQSAVKAANALSFALFATSVKGDGAAARAAGAVRDHTKALVSGAGVAAENCPEQGVAGTQAALGGQLAKARAGVEKACAN